MPLPDGTNDEKEDVQPPLEWTSKDDIKDVTLHQMKVSPPCAKIRVYLSYYGIPFKIVNKAKKDSSYKKVPVLLASGRQINDSAIILKNLVPVLTGQPFDEKWEMEITFGLQPSIEAECFGDKPSAAAFMKLAGVPCCFAGCLAGKFLGGIPAKLKERYPDMKPSGEYGVAFKTEMADKLFMGGEQPSQADISYYGTLLVFMTAKCPKAQDHLTDSGLQEWWERMTRIMPKF